jgi:hypothetical protein
MAGAEVPVSGEVLDDDAAIGVLVLYITIIL